MDICHFSRDLARFEAKQAAEAEADAILERECSLVRSICSFEELESVAEGGEIGVLERLVDRLAYLRIQRARAEAEISAASDRFRELQETCF